MATRKSPQNKRRVGKRVANQKQNSRQYTAPRSVIRGQHSESTVPALAGDMKMTKTFRYQSNAALNAEVYVGDLLGAYMFAVSSTSFKSLLGAVKLKEIALYDIGGSADVTISQVELIWESTGGGLFSGPQQVLSVTSTPLHPGVLVARPPPGSLASMWHSSSEELSSDAPLFSLNLPVGVICDITMEIVFLSTASLSLSYTGSGASSYETYATALDAQSTSKKLVPLTFTYTN